MHRAGGHRTENNGGAHPRFQRPQRFAQNLTQTGGLEDQSLQLGKDGALAVGLEVNLPPGLLAPNDPHRGQCRELALDRADAGAGEADDLPQVQLLVGPQQEDRQHGRAGLTEEAGGGRGYTHSGYNCIHNGYIGQGEA